MPESRSTSLRHWEAYYRGGALASCPLGPDAGYTLELRDIWAEFFSTMPDGARVLDIGTGNGAIALIASQVAVAAGRRFEIHGTDLAQIDPVRDVPDGARLFAGIQFHPQVPTEGLPFEAARFDAVSGQFALEYTDLERSLPEIGRVLRSGGAAQFVLHHADSIIARNARESLAQSTLVLEDTKILRKLRRYLEAERRLPSAARRNGADLTAALQSLAESSARTTNSLTLDVTIDAVRKLLDARKSLSTRELERAIDGFEGDIRAAARRLEDLVRSGQTQASIENLAMIAQRSGLEAQQLLPIHHGGGNLVGWRLRLLRKDRPDDGGRH